MTTKKKEYGPRFRKIGGKKYERGDVFSLKKDATEEAKWQRYHGSLIRLMPVPAGWALYYRLGRKRMPCSGRWHEQR